MTSSTRAVVFALLAALAVGGCDQNQNEQQAPPQAGGGGGGAPSGGGGGGDVPLGGGEPRQAPPAKRNPALEDRYDRAVKKINQKDYDAAYVELGALVSESPDSNLAARAAKDIEQVQGQLLAIPPTPPKEVLSKPKKFDQKPLSLLGAYRAVAPGDAPESFWVDAEGGKVQCRYPRLHPEAKRALATMPAGTKLLVRGFWKAEAAPYLDVSLFKIE